MNESAGRTPAVLPHWSVPALAFAAFGGLVGWRMAAGALAVGSGVAAGVLFGFLVSSVLVVALGIAFPGLGRAAVIEAAVAGFVLLLPFAILALATELLLGWQASQVFSSAALMTAGGTIGLDVARRGGGQLRSIFVPSAAAFLLSGAWVTLGTFAAANWKW